MILKRIKLFQRKKAIVNNSSITLKFQLPVYKTYSVALFQDLDKNEKLTTKGAMKVPDEPIGFSNNKMGRFGPPEFNEVSFRLNSDTLIQIHIISSRKEYYKRLQ